MSPIRVFRNLCLIAFAVSALGCGRTEVPRTAAKPNVFVDCYPVQYFAERIGGDAVAVHFPLPADEEDPEFWTPGAAVIEAYQKADLILLNGAGFSKWTATASLPLGNTVETTASFKTKYITIENAVTHSHGPAGPHTHAGTASYTWLDFTQAVEQAKAVETALGKLVPGQKAAFETRFRELERDLLALDGEMRAVVGKNGAKPLMGSHPIYQYWARRYGLKMKSVHWEPEDVPGPAEIAELKKLLVDHPAKWMIWEDEPEEETVAKLKELGLKCAVFDPYPAPPETGDFLTQMRKNIENARAVFAD